MARKFYKQTFVVEVLSEDEPLSNVSLSDIDYAITEGHCSGVIKEGEVVKVSGKEMAKLLIEQGSDPEFFQLNEKGRTIKE
jgi:hypothetical protein